MKKLMTIVAMVGLVAFAAEPALANYWDNGGDQVSWHDMDNWDGPFAGRTYINGKYSVVCTTATSMPDYFGLNDGAILTMNSGADLSATAFSAGGSGTVNGNGYIFEIYQNDNSKMRFTSWFNMCEYDNPGLWVMNDASSFTTTNSWFSVGADGKAEFEVHDNATVDCIDLDIGKGYEATESTLGPSSFTQTGGTVTATGQLGFGGSPGGDGGTYYLSGGVCTLGSATIYVDPAVTEAAVEISNTGALVVPGDQTGDLTLGGVVFGIGGSLVGAWDGQLTTITVEGGPVIPEPAGLGLVGLALLGLRRRRS